MYNELAVSPFQDEHLIGEINKARGQNAEGSQEQLKVPPITPIEPVMVAGSAKMWSAEAAT